MKKALVLLMLVVILMTSCVAFADFELSQYSDDEIIALLAAVQQEVVNRKIEKTANLPSGKYLAGRDIPAGNYMLTCKYDGIMWAYITITGEGGTGGEKFEGYVWSKDNPVSDGSNEQTWHIELKDGDLLESTDPFTLTISAGVKFF